jgi:bifunctional non-homologous end joining protein LigD
MNARDDPLARYRAKRDFETTPEPAGGPARTGAALQFVVQKHHASHLHYDFRLELDGTLKSWAVPKGPSLDPQVKRMAVQVEDHPLGYANFEGTIPPGQYGAGTVIVWDRGAWRPHGDARAGLAAGKLEFELEGEKLRGRWALVRLHGRRERQPAWLLMKLRDAAARPESEYVVVDAEPASVLQRAPAQGAGAKAKAEALAPAGAAATNQAEAAPAAKAAPASPKASAARRARRAALPMELAPQLATRVDHPPPGGGCTYEH